jgi:predicted thioesterase
VTRVEGRKLFFAVSVRDELDLIGEGTHERVVVNVARFDERVQAKIAGMQKR